VRTNEQPVEDETRNTELNGDRNPEWWGDFSHLKIQIKQKSQFEFVPRDSLEFKSNQNFNSTLYRQIPKDLIFSISTCLIKSPHRSEFRLPFNSAFRVSSSTERVVQIKSVRTKNKPPAVHTCLYVRVRETGLVPSESVLDWHGTSTGPKLFILCRMSGALSMFGVKTGQ